MVHHDHRPGGSEAATNARQPTWLRSAVWRLYGRGLRGGAMTRTRYLFGLGLITLTVFAASPLSGQAPKSGGWLNLRLREDLPQGFAINESPTISTMWPAMPCFNNLVLFDPAKPTHSADTIMGELAERWSWQDGYRKLVFFLRGDVTWHDGRPFSAKDVKHTFDLLREAPDAAGKLRLNPRREWYSNIEAIDAPDSRTVVFRLKRPQPSLLLMLASGYSPVYPAHVPPADLRLRCVGTGPFRLKDYARGQMIELERNPDYFVPGRPYLDGIRYPVITERGTRMAALQAGRLDTSMPLEMTKTMAEQVKQNNPSLVVTEIGQNGSDNVVINHRKPPFDNALVRRAVNAALDRYAYVQGVRHKGAIVGAALMPRPAGAWGLLEKD